MVGHTKKREFSWPKSNGSNGDSVSDFGFSLSRLVNRADGDLPWDARETIVVEQFIHGLDDTDLKRHVCFFVIQVL